MWRSGDCFIIAFLSYSKFGTIQASHYSFVLDLRYLFLLKVFVRMGEIIFVIEQIICRSLNKFSLVN